MDGSHRMCFAIRLYSVKLLLLPVPVSINGDSESKLVKGSSNCSHNIHNIHLYSNLFVFCTGTQYVAQMDLFRPSVSDTLGHVLICSCTSQPSCRDEVNRTRTLQSGLCCCGLKPG